MSNIIEVYTEEEFSIAKVTDKDFVYFWKDGCYYCDLMKPIIESLARQYTNVRFIKINNRSIAARNSVFMFPTSKYNGEKHIGYKPKSYWDEVLNPQR